MSGNIEIVDVTEEYVADALKISKVELGVDYQDESDFFDCIDNKDEFCKMALLDGKVVGFSICKLFGPDGVDEILKLPDCKERDLMMSVKKIGLLDSISIDNGCKGHGIGTILSDACIEKMESCGVDIICAVAWKSVYGHTNIKNLLEKIGMRESISMQGYWNLMVDSPEGHHCPICGAPDKCYGVLYYKLM